MKRNRLFIIAAIGVVSFAMFASSVSADTIVLTDATLLGLADVGGSGGGDLDLIVDTPGDPGVQYVITWVDKAGYTDIAIGKYSPTEVGIGDTWELEVKNLDPTYPTFARLYMQVDGWVYHQGPGVWLAAGGGTETINIVNPATTVVNALGIKLGTDDWTGRPTGSTVVVEIVPEPSLMALLGIGSLLMVLRRKRG